MVYDSEGESCVGWEVPLQQPKQITITVFNYLREKHLLFIFHRQWWVNIGGLFVNGCLSVQERSCQCSQLFNKCLSLIPLLLCEPSNCIHIVLLYISYCVQCKGKYCVHAIRQWPWVQITSGNSQKVRVEWAEGEVGDSNQHWTLARETTVWSSFPIATFSLQCKSWLCIK